MNFKQEEHKSATENIKSIVSFQDTLRLLLVLKKDWIAGDWYEGYLIPFSKIPITFKSISDRTSYVSYLVQNKMLLTKPAEFHGKPVTKYQLNERLKISESRIKFLEAILQLSPSGIIDDDEIMQLVKESLGILDE